MSSGTDAAAETGRAPSRRSPLRLILLPNIITLARLFSVPVLVWAISTGEHQIAFWLFVAAGISDAVDGFIAKRFGMESDLGAHLDPVADKALLVSIYVALGVSGGLPVWLTVLVVARDVLIVGAVLLALAMLKPIRMRPLPVSKVTTLCQIVLAALALSERAFDIGIDVLVVVMQWCVAGLTVASAGAYLLEWLRHMTGRTAR
jgi:cardiolipin synthase